MAYHVYHTEALFLSATPVGEGDRLFHCYTKELGLVQARARSIREGRSKLRYILQTFAHAEIDLVEGRGGWRLISARPITSFHSLWSNQVKRRIIAQHAALMRRLIQGEERHAELFQDVISGLLFIEQTEDANVLKDAELLLVVRLIAALGYWEQKEHLAPLLSDPMWSPECVNGVTPFRRELLDGVNQALSLSNL